MPGWPIGSWAMLGGAAGGCAANACCAVGDCISPENRCEATGIEDAPTGRSGACGKTAWGWASACGALAAGVPGCVIVCGMACGIDCGTSCAIGCCPADCDCCGPAAGSW